MKKKRLGLVTVCERFFAFGRFPKDYVSVESLFASEEDLPTILVNDVPVANVTKIGTVNSYCYVFYHKDESSNGDGDGDGSTTSSSSKYIFPSTSKDHGEGRFDFRFQVPQRGGQLYLSSIIVI